MNKATFSRLIKDSTHISDVDVQALEQVVQAFPYCQTAHMLLAKAASDKGSMLAPQRLRKAAIHAPSRALLKKLVEGRLSQQESEQVLSIASEKRIQSAYNEEIEDLIENDLPGQIYPVQKQTVAQQISAPVTQAEPVGKPEPEAEPSELIANLSPAETEEEIAIAESAPTETAKAEEKAPELMAELTPAETEEEVAIAESAPEEIAVVAQITEEVETAVDQQLETTIAGGLTEFLAGLQEQNLDSEISELDVLPDKTGLTTDAESEDNEQETGEIIAEETEAAQEAEVETAAEESTEISEKVQADSEADEEITGEQLAEIFEEPETEEKQLAQEITLEEEPETTLSAELVTEEPANADSLVFSIFRDSELGYAMSSSRMGESLQRKSELTLEVPFHFQPELLVEYQLAKTGQYRSEIRPEPKPETPPQQDLIDDFLKQAAKSRPRAGIMPKQEEQEDLSQKSTRLSKSIVSENLAQIFAMQGKTKKAIKIYQQLQLKMPEKKDYFAVLINKLQNHSS